MKVNGIDMSVRAAGKGPRTIVFIHALGTDSDIWEDIVIRTQLSLRSLRYDLRGHGGTEATSGAYSLKLLSGDLLAVLDTIGVARAIICGISIGGLIAQQAALDAPERVEGLVLCDTALRIGSAEGWQARIDAVNSRGLPAMANDITTRWYAPSFVARATARVTELRLRLAGMSAAGYIGACAALRDGDLRDQSHTIDVPTLVISGAADVATPPTQGRELAQAIPSAKFVEMANIGHLPCVEAPEQLAPLIESFLMDTKVD